MVASYLLDPSNYRHNLFDVALKYLNYKMIPIEDLIGKKKKDQISIKDVEINKLYIYACEDSDIAFRLKLNLEKKLKEKELISLFENIEMPILKILKEMEKNGISLDVNYLNSLEKEFSINLKEIEDKIFLLSGEKFNINSPKQLGEILFEKMQIKNSKKTKTGSYSTDIKVLEELKDDHEIIKYILEYRSLSKLKSTYVEALPKLISKKDNKLHTSYNQTVAASGRLSSSEPNLQNIPSKTNTGQLIRKAFVSENSDKILISADYSQIELRILAHYTKDENLIYSFNNKFWNNIWNGSIFFS
jgi:DNA polymerase-1